MNDPGLIKIVLTGLADSINPCAISVLLIYISLLFTLGKPRKEILTFGFFYISSVFVTYFTIGVFYFQALKYLTSIREANVSVYVMVGAGILTIIFALLNVKEYYFPNSKFSIRIPVKVRQKISAIAFEGTIISTIALGALVAITEFPCSGSVYIGAVTYIESRETLLKGIYMLLAYNLAFVFPLILIFIFVTNKVMAEKLINMQEKHGRKMHLFLAALMLLVGAFLIYTALDQVFFI